MTVVKQKLAKDMSRDELLQTVEELLRTIEELRAEKASHPNSMAAMMQADPKEARKIAKQIAPLKKSPIFWIVLPLALIGPILMVVAVIASFFTS